MRRRFEVDSPAETFRIKGRGEDRIGKNGDYGLVKKVKGNQVQICDI
jgi:hypothetical protein